MTTPYEDALAAVRATVRESARNCGKSGRKPCADCQKAVTAMTALEGLAERVEELEARLESASSTMATDPRDWSQSPRDAWLYGVIVGWGDALDEVARKHGWLPATVARMAALRAAASGEEK